MAWNKKGGAKITKKTAMEMIENFHKDKAGHVRSIYYDKEVFEQLLSTAGCAGVSIFFAKNALNENTLVLLPVDENGKSIAEVAFDVGNPCPPYC